MIAHTPRTYAELTAALAAAPTPTRPYSARLDALAERLRGSARCDLRALFACDAEYAATLRLFTSTRLGCDDLLVVLLGRLTEACARACAGRDVVAICDTTAFTLAGLAGRSGARARHGAPDGDAKALGRLPGGGATPGLKAHVVFCVDARDHRPLGLAHVLLYAAGGVTAKSAPRHERESARWCDAMAAALAGPLAGAARVTFVADAEADQFVLLSGGFLAAGAGGPGAGGPEVRWCFRMQYDRPVWREGRAYHSPHHPKVSTYLDGDGDAVVESRRRVRLPSSGKRAGRHADLRLRSAGVRVRRPKATGPGDFRGRELPRAARVHVTAVDECDGRGRPREVLGKRARTRLAERTGTHPPLRWVLATSFPVADAEAQAAVVRLYRSRWLVELFFRLVKTDGAAVERARTRRVDRWECLLLLCMEGALDAEALVAMRDDVDGDPAAVFDREERAVLEADDYARCHPAPVPGVTRPGGPGRAYRSPNKQPPATVAWYAHQVAILGGYGGNRSHPPGRTAMAKGLRILRDRVTALRQRDQFERDGPKSVG